MDSLKWNPRPAGRGHVCWGASSEWLQVASIVCAGPWAPLASLWEEGLVASRRGVGRAPRAAVWIAPVGTEVQPAPGSPGLELSYRAVSARQGGPLSSHGVGGALHASLDGSGCLFLMCTCAWCAHSDPGGPSVGRQISWKASGLSWSFSPHVPFTNSSRPQAVVLRPLCWEKPTPDLNTSLSDQNPKSKLATPMSGG